MDSLDSASFDSSSAATLGREPGSSSGATSADAGAGGNGSTDDMGWVNTSSPSAGATRVECAWRRRSAGCASGAR